MSVPPPPPPEQKPAPPGNWKLPAAEPLGSADRAELQDLAEPPAGEIDVVNWRTGEPEEIAAQFEPLREFTDWLIQVFRLNASIIPPCWWRHPVLVQELYGLYCFHAAAYPATDQGSGPLGFLERFNLARERMKNAALETRCTLTEHKTLPARKVLTAVSEDWYALSHGDESWLGSVVIKESR